MSAAALGEAVHPPGLGHSTTTREPPIPESVDSSKGSTLEMMKTLPNDPSLEASTVNRSSPGNGVNELLQRALSLKDGTEMEEDLVREGERTPGSHSRASTDLTAVEQSRISPAESTSRTESSSRPSGSRNNSLNTDPSPPASRFRTSASSSSRRPPSRPYAPAHHPSQQRITPPTSWNASSPSSSSDGNNYPLAFNPPPQFYYPSQPYGTAHPQQGGGAGVGGGGYAYSTTSPPFLSQSGRHPSHISQISQISDQSAGYSTGSPYSSSSSLWYHQYASTVTTPSGYPTPIEGGLLYTNDTSPEASSEGLSSSQCGPGYQLEGSMQAGYGQGQQFVEPSNPSSPPNPYQPVYFAPPPQRMAYASPPPSRVSPTAYTTSAAPSSPPSAGQTAPMAYPISSARPPHAVDQGAPPAPPSSTYALRGQEQHWPAPLHQQTLVPTHQPPYQSYAVYSGPPQPGAPIEQRRYHHQVPNAHGLPPNPGFVQYPSHPQNPSSRSFPRPPAIPPRPIAGQQHFSPRSAPQQYPPSSPPKIYAPPVEIARGVLASTRLREAAQPSNSVKPVRATRNESAGQFVPRKGNLPKPPAHSPHALWVGNVPSDASHSELWQFFVSRPSPSAMGHLSKEDIDLTTPGVESIHLIARSNCAFVNYISDLHLQHAISVSNGLSLRPNDPRCKTLLCRVRKQEDESKTGVGAQRIGGIHKAFVKLQSERMGESEQALRLKIEEEGAEPKSAATKAFEERRQSSSSVSIGTTSTTSSFLTKHFEKRWFIMKSHDEADLKLSVESGLWATQPHNEPVLQQAFRTAKEVFLVFSANGSGEWFGYARMTGPISSISSKSSRPSWSSSGQASVEESISSASLSAPSQTIQEDSDEPSSFPPRAPVVIFSPSEHRLAQASPSMITPSPAPQSQLSDQRQGGSYPMKLPSEIDAEAKREMALEQERMAFVTATNLHLPAEVAEAARKAATYDSAALVAARKGRVANDEVYPGGLRDAIRRVDMATGEEEITKTGGDDDARKPARSGSSSTWGTPFSVEWVKVSRLPFSRTRHIRNSFNGNREIKVSRDGTEVEPAAGQALIDEFARLPDSPDPQQSPSGTPVSRP